MSLSIVVPVHEDREACLAMVPRLVPHGEVVVVDSSHDDPVREKDLPEGVVLVRSGVAQRARQMNLGAERAGGSELLFLHADTVLDEEHFRALSAVWDAEEVVGGGFSRRFDSGSVLLRFTSWLADWRGRWFGWFLGDQAIFVRKSDFVAAGGFRSLKIFEDYDLCRRLKRRGKMRCLAPPIRSSARRFCGGVVRRVLGDLGLTVVYLIRGSTPFAEE